jgi:hypothetical protein
MPLSKEATQPVVRRLESGTSDESPRTTFVVPAGGRIHLLDQLGFACSTG